ncbi:MAG: LytTR family DNA-binding domain-containing protein [Eubacteriales bacterium]|nr:LytTR family DNA-binding domain-containing protein [Eubacteriales bacterium]
MDIALCEDNIGECNAISAMLEQYSVEHMPAELTYQAFRNADALLRCRRERGRNFDLYLLDILMEGLNGMELARTLRAEGDRGRIVFLTSSPDFALGAFSVNAAGYLLKPITRGTLFETLNAAEEDLRLRNPVCDRQFTIRTPGALRSVSLRNILYVEIIGHTPYFHLCGEIVRGSEMRVAFNKAMEPLLQTGCFFRPHRSFLVNARHVSSFSAKALMMDDDSIVPVARQRAAEAKAAYLDALLQEERLRG